jgi:hypothetical protein
MSELTQVEIVKNLIDELILTKKQNKELSTALAIALVNPKSTDRVEIQKAQSQAQVFDMQYKAALEKIKQLESKLSEENLEENKIKSMYEVYTSIHLLQTEEQVEEVIDTEIPVQEIPTAEINSVQENETVVFTDDVNTEMLKTEE